MSEKINFQAEVNKMLGIVINSLYSEKYIFLRELISNASDACDKLKYLQLTKPDAAKGNGELKITITPDEKENTLTIADNGIGMNRDDLINHLGTIVKSGTADFVANMKENGSPADLIGQFGVGFYSAFMVAKKVEIVTRKAGEEQAWRWISDGVDGFEINEAEKAGKNIMFEAQLGALRDIDFGIFPYTSSSSSNAGYACVGAGIPGSHVDRTVGIVKAYSTCVGEGPFTAEWFGDEAEQLRVAGGEYGASTGRPRRVGPIDLVATRYGCRIQGATEVALTKLDVLSYMKEIPVCTQYEVNGEKTDDFPFTAVIDEAKPVLTTVPGWGCDISGVRKYEDLPQAARDYVEYVEKAIGVHISYVSVGAGRDEIIYR